MRTQTRSPPDRVALSSARLLSGALCMGALQSSIRRLARTHRQNDRQAMPAAIEGFRAGESLVQLEPDPNLLRCLDFETGHCGGAKVRRHIVATVLQRVATALAIG